MSHDQVSCPLEHVQTCARPFDRYRPYASAKQFDAVLDRARRLKGLRVIEINSTPRGGGVATMLHSILPALQGLGLDARWYSMCDERAFFEMTKQLMDLLQGANGHVTPADRDLYCKVSTQLAAQVDKLSADVLVIHCPQPAAILSLLRRQPSCGSIWRGHIDLAHPNPAALAFLEPFLCPYDLIVLEVRAYCLPGIPSQRQRFVPDAIDPLTTKNKQISRDDARQIMASVGIDISRPVVTQVARFDHRKNPIGVVDAYRLACRSVPGLQLAMLGTLAAQDDPTAEAVYEEVKRYVGNDPNVHLFADPKVIGQPQVDAFQTGSDAILLLSEKEGFGIAATEAMWKFNAVVGTDAPGISAQIDNGVDGFLVSSVDEGADRIVTLVRDRALARQLGQQAHETVCTHFLLPRLIDDWLGLFEGLSRRQAARAA
ncbi:MAG TPA: glycosyltransferase [Chloroflexota bacterium]|nr:glycosyltransferase [Chloroflexota bacterium]